MHQKEKPRHVHDNVHGLICLTHEEMAVIDHPLFQRLRNIHQTGLVRYIWPTAVHRRFEHSIGTLHMAHRMLEGLEHGSEADASKLASFYDVEPGQAVRYHTLEPNVHRELTRIVRLTALVHDLGHGPLSHVFDGFAPSLELVRDLLKDERLAVLQPFEPALLESKNGRLHHESGSCILFATIWNELGGEPWIVQAVASALLGKPLGMQIHPDLIPWMPFVRDIVASAPIDADRMDYLLRDSRAHGVSYGLYEADRILKSVLCVRANGGYRLGWRLSAIRSIEAFVTSRFNLFAQVYTHKTLRAIEHMLDAMTRDAATHGSQIFDSADLDAFVQRYLDLSDESLLAELSRMPATHGRIAEIAKNLRWRKLWKRLYDYERDESQLVDAHLAGMREAYPDAAFIVDRMPPGRGNPMKDLMRGAYLMRIGPDGKYRVSADNRSWIESSPIMRMLRDEEQSRIRLFVECSDNRLTRPMREHAIALATRLREGPLPE